MGNAGLTSVMNVKILNFYIIIHLVRTCRSLEFYSLLQAGKS